MLLRKGVVILHACGTRAAFRSYFRYVDVYKIMGLFVSEGCVCYFAYGMRHSEIAIVPEVMALPEEEQGLIDRRSSDGNRDLRHVPTESVSPLRI